MNEPAGSPVDRVQWSLTVVTDSDRQVRPQMGRRTLTEVLTRDERMRVTSGEIVAVREPDNSILNPDVRLDVRDQTIRLRLPDPKRDLARIGIQDESGTIVPIWKDSGL